MRNGLVKKQYRRILAALLVCLAAAQLNPFTPVTVEADAAYVDFDGKKITGTEYGTATFYEWHRILTQNDIPKPGTRCPVMILWQYNGDVYNVGSSMDKGKLGSWGKWDYFSGTRLDTDDPFIPNPFDDNSDGFVNTSSFVTLEKTAEWEMTVTDKLDDKNENVRRVRLHPSSSTVLTGWDDFDRDKGDSAEDDLWSLYTSEVKYNSKKDRYGKHMTAGQVMIYCQVSGDDTGFMWHDDKCFGYCDSTYNYDKFIVYWGEERTFSAITDDFTIGEGQIMNIDDGVLLMDGVTVTVEPGGVLSVEGQFYNNGVIENNGTVVIQKDACMCSFTPTRDDAGKLVCDGGAISAASSASGKLALAKEEREILAEDEEYMRYVCSREDFFIYEYEEELEELKTEELTDKLSRLKDDVDEAEYDLKRAEDRLDEKATELGDLSEAELAENADYKALSDAAEQCRTALNDVKAKYDEAYAPVRELEQDIVNARETLARDEAELAGIRAKLAELDKKIKRYQQAVDEGRGNVTPRGEGSLIVMENARVVLNPVPDSVLTVRDGGSCVCSGYIVSPNTVELSDAKLEIRKTGALIVGHTFTSFLGSPRVVQPQDADKPTFTFPGLTKYADASSVDILLNDASCVIELDGILKTAGSGAYCADPRGWVSPQYKTGHIWS